MRQAASDRSGNRRGNDSSARDGGRENQRQPDASMPYDRQSEEVRPSEPVDLSDSSSESSGPNSRIVKEGDTFGSIAKELLGDSGQASVLKDLNPDVSELKPFMFIKVPSQEQLAQFAEAREMEGKKEQPPPPVDVPESTADESSEEVSIPDMEPSEPISQMSGPEEASEGVCEAPEVSLESGEVQGPEATGGGFSSAVEELVYPTTDTTAMMDNTVSDSVPPVSLASEAITAAAAQTGELAPAGTGAEEGFGAKVLTGLHDSFFGPWSAVLTPFGLGDRGQNRAKQLGENISKAWNQIGKGDNAFLHIRDVLDLVYKVCDAVTGFTGPLGTILGIASYIRYIPFPATIAIGNWMKVISSFLNTLTFILDVVKVVTGALKVVFGALGIFASRDPDVRAEYTDMLRNDAISLVTDGISVAFTVATGGHKTKYPNGFTSTPGTWLRNPASAFRQTHQAIRNDTLGQVFGLTIASTSRSSYFGNAVKEIATEQLTDPGLYYTLFDNLALSRVAETLEAPERDKSASEAASGGGLAQLGVATPAAQGNTGSDVRALQQQSREALVTAAEESPTPATDNPMAPPQTARAPYQLAPLAEEKMALMAVEEELLRQQEFAQSGIEENQAWCEAADEHLEGVQADKESLEGAKQATDEDKAEVKEGQQTVQEGKKDSDKGSSKAGESENGPGGGPGDANTSELKWYQKPFAWVIRKLNQAKQKVQDAIMKAVMKALENVLNFDDLDTQLDEADGAIDEQNAVLDAEPGKLDEAASAMATEASNAQNVRSEAEQNVAENEQIKSQSEADYEAVKAQREAIEAEEEAVKADTESYHNQYTPTADEMQELAKAREEGEVAPLRLELDARRAILEQMLDVIAASLEGQKGSMLDLILELSSNIDSNLAAEFSGDPAIMAGFMGSVIAIEGKLTNSTDETIGTRKQILEDLRARVAAVASGEPTTQMLLELNAIEAEIVEFAEAMDQKEEIELLAIHGSFADAYGFIISWREKDLEAA